MTVTLHKILVHGARIIELSPLPIGMLSEQGAEYRNKYWRFDRQHHCRKITREAAMFDLIHRALVSSDPIITDFGMKERKHKLRKNPLPREAAILLKSVDYNYSVPDIDDNEENIVLPNGD